MLLRWGRVLTNFEPKVLVLDLLVAAADNSMIVILLALADFPEDNRMYYLRVEPTRLGPGCCRFLFSIRWLVRRKARTNGINNDPKKRCCRLLTLIHRRLPFPCLLLLLLVYELFA